MYLLFKFLFFLGVVFTPLGALFYWMNRFRMGDKMLRDGAWRHFQALDASWMVAKPFLFGGMVLLVLGAIGLVLAAL